MLPDSELSTIDLVQDFLEATGWDFHRQAENLITFSYQGEWNKFNFAVAEKQMSSGIETLIQCQTKFVIPTTLAKKTISLTKVHGLLRELFDIIHGDMPRGTFHSLTQPGRIIIVNWSYRLAMGESLDIMRLELVMNEAQEEADEFYPAIRQVLMGNYTAQESYDMAIPAVYGHA